MSRNVNELHPVLQNKVEELKALCKENGITIGISECLRTMAEQNALYAKGRTAPGSVVTNCKGTSYSSMHQWGIAFDFYLDMDVDGDEKKSDDAFNNATRLFDKVGKLGQSIGLEWGGGWRNKDLPHFQLPDWGSTASKLKSTYGTPATFMATWDKSAAVEKESAPAQPGKETYSKNVYEPAPYADKSIAGTYKTTANLNLRSGAGTGKAIITTMPRGSQVTCYQYYAKVNGQKWYLVEYGKYAGYCSAKYLQRR